MRFLADENFPLKSVYLLRQAGHDVAAIIEDSPGAKDRDILIRTGNERRVLLTFDRDYERLIFLERIAASTG